MKKNPADVCISFIIALLIICSLPALGQIQNNKGYILEHEQEIAQQEPGTHNGGGVTTGFSFFAKADSLKLVFRKRILRPGSSIGYHLQEADEIYYIVTGKGEMKINEKIFPVNAGDAILTRPGNWHGLKPTGSDSLVVIINYLNNAVKN